MKVFSKSSPKGGRIQRLYRCFVGCSGVIEDIDGRSLMQKECYLLSGQNVENSGPLVNLDDDKAMRTPQRIKVEDKKKRRPDQTPSGVHTFAPAP
jgi:hypothetical protein